MTEHEQQKFNYGLPPDVARRFDEEFNPEGRNVTKVYLYPMDLKKFLANELTQAHTEWKAEVRRELIEEIDKMKEFSGINIGLGIAIGLPSLQDTEKETDVI